MARGQSEPDRRLASRELEPETRLGYSEADIEKILGGKILRVMEAAEMVMAHSLEV